MDRDGQRGRGNGGALAMGLSGEQRERHPGDGRGWAPCNAEVMERLLVVQAEVPRAERRAPEDHLGHQHAAQGGPCGGPIGQGSEGPGGWAEREQGATAAPLVPGEGDMVGEAKPLHPVGLGDLAADDDHAVRVGAVADVLIKFTVTRKAEGVANPSLVTVVNAASSDDGQGHGAPALSSATAHRSSAARSQRSATGMAARSSRTSLQRATAVSSAASAFHMRRV